MKGRISFNRLLSATALLFLASVSSLAQKPELVMQTGHPGFVTSVAFSPDGKTIASGSVDGTVKLWDVSTGTGLRTLKGNPFISSVAFSPDGEILASGGDGIKLWNVRSGKELRTL